VVGLDGFFFATFALGDATCAVRAGRQVISWGESTFIPNGINVINPVDLSKVRIPGSELKEAFIPTSGLWASFQLTKSATIEGFYLTNWDKVRLDPRGSYFSNNDLASDDANRLIVTFGRRKGPALPAQQPDTPHHPRRWPRRRGALRAVRPRRASLGAALAGPQSQRQRAVRLAFLTWPPTSTTPSSACIS
jgi:hypothetical protein